MSDSIDSHPLGRLFHRVALGDFPAPDGEVDVMEEPPGPVDAVLAFTAHHIVAGDVSRDWVHSNLEPDDLSAPMSPRFLAALGQRLGSEPGSLDIVLCALGRAGEPEMDLVERTTDIDHPRVERARRYRTDIRVFATPDDTGILIIGRGLAGRWEASFEIEESSRNRGLGRAVVAAARSLIEPGEPLFMQTAPGNAASLRAILACGFRPLGGEVLFVRGASTV